MQGVCRGKSRRERRGRAAPFFRAFSDQLRIAKPEAHRDGGVNALHQLAVHTAHDIVCYESGRDFTYGEGTESAICVGSFALFVWDVIAAAITVGL